jgi:hypothetical protein
MAPRATANTPTPRPLCVYRVGTVYDMARRATANTTTPRPLYVYRVGTVYDNRLETDTYHPCVPVAIRSRQTPDTQQAGASLVGQRPSLPLLTLELG